MDIKLSSSFGKNDLRVQKTYKSLYNAMFKLLLRRNFNDITVNDLCAEALVSRATFYTHFNDKYDLLKYMLTEWSIVILLCINDYDVLEKTVNDFADNYPRVLINVAREINAETYALFHNFITEIVAGFMRRSTISLSDSRTDVLVNFAVGGLYSHFSWMVRNNFPREVRLLTPYLYNMLCSLSDWGAEQENIMKPGGGNI